MRYRTFMEITNSGCSSWDLSIEGVAREPGHAGEAHRSETGRNTESRLCFHFHGFTGGKKMNKLVFAIFAVAALGVSSPAATAPAGGTGIVKGTITIGGKPTAEAVVSIEDLAEEQGVAAKAQKKLIDQRNQQFIPTVVAIRVGDTVDFPNNDKFWHNVYSKGGANDFDLGLYPPGKTRSQKFDKTGVSRILCNAHPKMEAFVVVKDHPFFSATNSRGIYEIKNVPVGRYRIEIWHPNLPVRSETVEIVRDREVFTLDVDLKKR